MPIRHAVEVRHPSFQSPDFVAVMREHGVAIVTAGDSDFPQIADVTADFAYARIMGTKEDEKLGYPSATLTKWVERAKEWAEGKAPKGLETFGTHKPDGKPRDVFLYVISGHKVRNPAAAMAMIERLAK
jgi:uncharacterized protein YecE (DUF72 family)